MERLTVRIEGMSCGHCVARVRKALESVPGVRVDQVAIGSAQVGVDPAVTDRRAVAGAISAAGFRVVAGGPAGRGCCGGGE
jgi:copper chaperone CopZ